MLVSFGAYWALYGWMFGLGLVLSIYVHEMGHVWVVRKLGFAASAPMFLPLMGAFVRLHQRPSSPREDARIGLGGPIWGTAGAAATFGLYYLDRQAGNRNHCPFCRLDQPSQPHPGLATGRLARLRRPDTGSARHRSGRDPGLLRGDA
jgi:hypothetical protein